MFSLGFCCCCVTNKSSSKPVCRKERDSLYSKRTHLLPTASEPLVYLHFLKSCHYALFIYPVLHKTIAPLGS